MAELDQWADLAAAGDRAFPGGAPPADADSMSYEELCQAHIEAFIQVCLSMWQKLSPPPPPLPGKGEIN